MVGEHIAEDPLPGMLDHPVALRLKVAWDRPQGWPVFQPLCCCYMLTTKGTRHMLKKNETTEIRIWAPMPTRGRANTSVR